MNSCKHSNREHFHILNANIRNSLLKISETVHCDGIFCNAMFNITCILSMSVVTNGLITTDSSMWCPLCIICGIVGKAAYTTLCSSCTRLWRCCEEADTYQICKCEHFKWGETKLSQLLALIIFYYFVVKKLCVSSFALHASQMYKKALLGAS